MMGENSPTSQTPPPLPDIWKDSQFFSFSLGASCSDFLLLPLILPAVFLLLPCLPFYHATSSHLGPQPYPSFLQNNTHTRFLSRADFYRRFGLKAREIAAQRGADSISGPPSGPRQHHPSPQRCCFCSCSTTEPSLCFLSPYPLLITPRPWGCTISKQHAHLIYFPNWKRSPLLRGLLSCCKLKVLKLQLTF